MANQKEAYLHLENVINKGVRTGLFNDVNEILNVAMALDIIRKNIDDFIKSEEEMKKMREYANELEQRNSEHRYSILELNNVISNLKARGENISDVEDREFNDEA